jgi:hypothetical protein
MFFWTMIILVYVPWLVVTIAWYISLFYRIFLHAESKNKTSDFQVKILTIGDNEEVLNDTINAAPKPPLIISRKKVSFPNNYVIPDTFQSSARFKGEQIEWSRLEHPANYTLYLDEDSICSTGMDSIPDADIVQFNEVPVSNNWLIASIEAHRIGFQTEQALFEKIKPFYLWGGGFAIKQWLEDKITWDRDSITEDTAFIFNIPQNARFIFSKQKIYNQAPPTLRALFKQRRRWASGALTDIKYHPNLHYRIWVGFRSINWGLWAILAPLSFFMATEHWIFFLPLLQAMLWSFLGARVMNLSYPMTIVTTITAPLSGVLHSVGACMAFVSKAKTFDVTPKVVMLPNLGTNPLPTNYS